MSDFPQTLSECSILIPNSLQELIGNQERNKQISDYCKNAFEQEDKNNIFQQTKVYALDSLLNVTYNVYKMGNQIKNYLDLQERELEKLQLQISTLSMRINKTHSMRGKSCFKTMEDPKEYKWHARETKQQLGSIPGFQRVPLSIRMLQNDDVGICLQKGGDIDPNWGLLPGYNQPNPIELTSGSGNLNQVYNQTTSNPEVPFYETSGYSEPQTSNFPPPNFGNTPPPPNFGGDNSFPPPPPNFGGDNSFPPPPPNFGNTPPPPPSFGGGNNFPPPPPNNQTFDFPPPPPPSNSGGFPPPPPNNNFPPPPPNSQTFDFPPPPPPNNSGGFPPPPPPPF